VRIAIYFVAPSGAPEIALARRAEHQRAGHTVAIRDARSFDAAHVEHFDVIESVGEIPSVLAAYPGRVTVLAEAAARPQEGEMQVPSHEHGELPQYRAPVRTRRPRR
jgi:hypothetical protein